MGVTIIYGSDGGCTRDIAKKIAAKISGKAIDITDAEPVDMEHCSLLILGCPTYADGELQTDWSAHLGKLEEAELSLQAGGDFRYGRPGELDRGAGDGMAQSAQVRAPMIALLPQYLYEFGKGVRQLFMLKRFFLW